MNLPRHKYITSPRDWQACLEKLKSEPRLAIDLEANSMYAYRERVCLIQISIPTQDYLIDPLVHLDLSGLGDLIADPDVEKIFHAAEYDLTLLKREYNWKLNNLFDTMWAARILSYPRYSLANLLGTLFQVKLNKRYQKSNWCQRPLSVAQRTYAQLDTHFLFKLRDLLSAELVEAGCVEEAHEIFTEQTFVKPSDNEFSADGFWSINGVQNLNRQQQAVLKELNIYREQEAKRRNKPHFKILTNKTLIQAAESLPSTLDQLQTIHGMTPGQIRRHGRPLLRVIKSGLQAPPPAPRKRNKRPSEKVLNSYDKLHRWRKHRAKARGVESDVIISRTALWAIAAANPQTTQDLTKIDELGEWRRKSYGQEILDVLQNKK